MSNVVKIFDLKNEIEASLISSILDEKKIPHHIKSHHDSAYDGIWQTQYGWGFIEAPEEYKDEIIEIYYKLKNTKPDNIEKIRCKWANAGEELADYHDHEYGFRITDDVQYFERLTLEIFQAGLSWATILKKRGAFRNAFDAFDFYKIAEYDAKRVESLLQDELIIRNRKKIEATIYNANVFIDIIKKYESFNDFLLTQPINNEKELLKIFKNHFKFMGTLILEEFMMSVGLWRVKHEEECFLYKKV